MLDIAMEGAPHKYWAEKDYWSDRDLISMCWGGLENLTECDADEFNRMKSKVSQAIISGELKEEKIIAAEVFFTRNNAVKWASENLKNFPFQPKDFDPVPKREKRPGTDCEETQLRMIGILAVLLAEKCGEYKKGTGAPNKSKIADAVIDLLEHFQEESPNLNGLGKTSLRTAIQRGLAELFLE